MPVVPPPPPLLTPPQEGRDNNRNKNKENVSEASRVHQPNRRCLRFAPRRAPAIAQPITIPGSNSHGTYSPTPRRAAQEMLEVGIVLGVVLGSIRTVRACRRTSALLVVAVETFITTSTAEFPGVVGVDGVNMHCA